MRVEVISIFPEMFAALTGSGITRRAIDRGLYALGFHNPRDFTSDPHRTVDDRPYGGGPGMVMMAGPLEAAVNAAQDARAALAWAVPPLRCWPRLDSATIRRAPKHWLQATGSS